MSTKKTIAAKKAEEINAPAAEAQSSQVENKPDNEGTPPYDAGADQRDDSGDQQTDEAELVGLDVVSMEFRTAGWQLSALMRLMGWENGKKVSRAEYEAALDQLNNRRQGGGRC